MSEELKACFDVSAEAEIEYLRRRIIVLLVNLKLANKRIDNLRIALQYIGYPPDEWDDPSDRAINALDNDNALQKLEE